MARRVASWTRAGMVFDVTDAGPAGGEPVVLLHGFPQDRTCWDAVTPALQGAGLRTFAPDQRGYAPRARPSGRGAYRLSECALDVVALLDAAERDRAHVVGHDWGGAVAWLLAGGHADRVRTLTVLSTPHPRAVARTAVRSLQLLRSWYMGLFQLPWLPERVLPGTLERSLSASGLPRATAARYAERLREPGAMAGALGWYRAMPWSVCEGVPPAVVPTTYVWGRRDVALGRQAARATGTFVQAPYRFVELDAGHWLPEVRPAECAEAILTRVGAESGTA